MTTNLIATGSIEAPPDRTLVALTPGEVGPAQAHLLTWCQQKIRTLSRDLREQRSNERQAKKLKWKHTGWSRQVTKTKATMIYYTKIRQAVKAGYLIVPNFDVDLIAVRTSRLAPPKTINHHLAIPEALPPRQGRYVDDHVQGYDQEREVKRADGTKGTVTDFHPTDFNEQVDFPVQLVKPIILAATERAMSLQLFDRIGVVRGSRRSDPIVVGQIIDPRSPNLHRAWAHNPKCVSFFVAWWLDTRAL